jgi:hypothetical protein
MGVGTKSLLIGVHELLWHPITVYLGWCRLCAAVGVAPD